MSPALTGQCPRRIAVLLKGGLPRVGSDPEARAAPQVENQMASAAVTVLGLSSVAQ